MIRRVFWLTFPIIALMAMKAEADAEQQQILAPMYATKNILCWLTPDFKRAFKSYKQEDRAWVANNGKAMYIYYASPEERILTMWDSSKPVVCIIDFETLTPGKDS